jgi:hypothetical protein
MGAKPGSRARRVSMRAAVIHGARPPARLASIRFAIPKLGIKSGGLAHGEARIVVSPAIGPKELRSARAQNDARPAEGQSDHIDDAAVW